MNSTVLLTLILQLLVPTLASSSGRYKSVETQKIDLVDVDCSFRYNICNKTQLDDSQETKLKSIVDLHPALHSFFTNGTVYETLEKSPDDGLRSIGTSDQYESLCWAEDVTYVPSAVLTVDYKLKPIVNQDKYKQIIKVKICRKSSHKNHCTSLSGYGTYRQAKCVQRWSTITLLSIDEDSQQPEYVRVNIPSDCVCTVINKEN
ncbi:uncharacterized protein LOC135129057 [Zophobas morio]|uniref:uncharacterized protein LOC135129057 n=1 Tax=Zophobas morio TaxID=2755281 RepID=UPI003082AF9E